MKLCQLLLAVLVFTACNQPPSTNTEPVADTDLPGTLVATIDFKLTATAEEKEIFEEGIIPWISIEKAEEEIPRLLEADKTVLPYKEVTLVIDYPLNKAAYFELSAAGEGFTRQQLIREISSRYHKVYEEEETSATVKTIPVDEREGLINRNETDGKYGIWGHDLGDLDLSAVEVYKNAEGKIVLLLQVES